MNLDLQKRWTERWEGRRSFAYDDKTGKRITPDLRVEGKPTIAVGLNLATAAAHQLIVGLGLDFAGVSTGQIALTDPEIDHLLEATISTAIAEARHLFPAFDQYPGNVQLVLTDLAFNMGAAKLATFPHTCAAVRQQNWPAAAQNLRDSAWFHQVGAQPYQRGGADVAVLGGTAAPESILGF